MWRQRPTILTLPAGITLYSAKTVRPMDCVHHRAYRETGRHGREQLKTQRYAQGALFMRSSRAGHEAIPFTARLESYKHAKVCKDLL